MEVWGWGVHAELCSVQPHRRLWESGVEVRGQGYRLNPAVSSPTEGCGSLEPRPAVSSPTEGCRSLGLSPAVSSPTEGCGSLGLGRGWGGGWLSPAVSSPTEGYGSLGPSPAVSMTSMWLLPEYPRGWSHRSPGSSLWGLWLESFSHSRGYTGFLKGFHGPCGLAVVLVVMVCSTRITLPEPLWGRNITQRTGRLGFSCTMLAEPCHAQDRNGLEKLHFFF